MTTPMLTTIAIAVLAAVVVAIAVVAAVKRSLAGAEAAARDERLTTAENLGRLHLAERDQARETLGMTRQEIARLGEANRRLEVDTTHRAERIAELGEDIRDLQHTLTNLRSQFEGHKAEAGARQEHAAAHIREIELAREAMKTEFRVLAEDALRQQGAQFKEQNAEHLGGLLAPLQMKLTDYQTGLEQARLESAQSSGKLEAQIKMLGEQSEVMTRGADDLVRALKSDTQVQGAWGEMVLESILDRSGLRKGEEYATQVSTTTEDGGRLRPDVVVNLPNEHHIILDSKVSLVAFERHVNGADESIRKQALVEHLRSLRAHVRGLGKKRYEAELGFAPDYVIMFVPVEGALSAALGADPDFSSFALDHNVTIASPTSLMTLLRTVSSLWQVDRRNRNAEAIAEQAGKLYDKFAGFVKDMEQVGSRLGQTQVAHDAAMLKLAGGRGNLVRQTEILRELGAKSTKTLDSAMLEDAGAQLPPDRQNPTPNHDQPIEEKPAESPT